MSSDEAKLEIIKKHIGEYPDFPKKGIIFKDIFTALRNGEVCTVLKELILSHIRSSCPNIDVVVGLDARGFLFSLLIASELRIACVPVRKKGKLPGECVSVEYDLEYGSQTFEMQKDAIKPGQKVLIIDDLLATGGSMEAAIKLVQHLQGDIVETYFIMELIELGGRKRIENVCKVDSLLQY